MLGRRLSLYRFLVEFNSLFLEFLLQIYDRFFEPISFLFVFDFESLDELLMFLCHLIDDLSSFALLSLENSFEDVGYPAEYVLDFVFPPHEVPVLLGQQQQILIELVHPFLETGEEIPKLFSELLVEFDFLDLLHEAFLEGLQLFGFERQERLEGAQLLLVLVQVLVQGLQVAL